MTIHHFESRKHWTSEVDFSRFDEGDVVIALDPQERLGHPTYSVCEIDHEDAGERLIHRGLFWKIEEARRYAYSLHTED